MAKLDLATNQGTTVSRGSSRSLEEMADVNTPTRNTQITAPQGNTNVARANYKAEAILGDVSNILGTGGKVAQVMDDTAVGIAKRNAASNIAERDKAILEATINEDDENADFRAMDAEVERIHQYYGSIEYDNKEADNAFNLMYRVEGYKSVGKTRQRLEQKALVQDATKVKQRTLNDLGFNIEQGSYNEDLLNVAKDRIKDTGGYIGYTVEALEQDVMTMRVANFSNVIKMSDYYDAGGNFDKEAYDMDFEEYYSDVAEKDINDGMSFSSSSKAIGELVEKSYNDTLSSVEREAKATKTAFLNKVKYEATAHTWTGQPYMDERGVYHHYAPTFKSFNEQVTAKYGNLLTDTEHNAIMNIYKKRSKEATASLAGDVTDYVERFNREITQMVENDKILSLDTVEKFDNEAEQLLNNPLISKSQAFSIKRVRKDLEFTKKAHNKVFNDITQVLEGGMTIKDAKYNYENGTVIDINGERRVAKPDVYNGMYNRQIASMSTNLQSYDMNTQDGDTDFKNKLHKLSVMTMVTGGGKPELFKRFDGIISDRTAVYSMNTNDIKQYVAYMDYQFTANPKEYGPYVKNIRDLKAYIDVQDKDLETDNNTKLMQLRTYTSQALKFQTKPRNASTMWLKELDNVSTGNNYGGTINNQPVPHGLHNVLMSMYSGEYTEEALHNYVDSFDFYEVEGKYGLMDNYRIITPDSMVNDEISFLLDYYLSKEDGIDANNVIPVPYEHITQSGASDIGYTLKYKNDKGNMIPIGQITHDAYISAKAAKNKGK